MLKKHKQQNHVIDILFVIALFAVFAISAVVVTLIGANVYKTITAQANDHYTTRTASAYLLEKIRSANQKDSVSVNTIDGTDVLALTEAYGEDTYVTYIYCYDGELKELFVNQENEFRFSDGTDIMELDTLSFSMEEDGLLTFIINEGGDLEQTVSTCVLSGGESQ